MFRSQSLLQGTARPRRWLGVVAAVACLGASGCTSLDFRGDGFPGNPSTPAFRQGRSSQGSGDFFGFSNKARQIEQDCGIQ